MPFVDCQCSILRLFGCPDACVYAVLHLSQKLLFHVLGCGVGCFVCALGEEPLCFCERPCHGLECPLQDPIPRALWDNPRCLFSLPIPHPFPQGSPCTSCLSHSPISPSRPHQRHGPLCVEVVCWCHTKSYLT